MSKELKAMLRQAPMNGFAIRTLAYIEKLEAQLAARCSADSAQPTATDIVERLRAPIYINKHFDSGKEYLDPLRLEAADEIESLRALPQTAPMPQNVEVAIKRMKTLADTALPGRAYEEECQAQMRNACVLLEMAYRSQAESVQRQDQTPVSYQRRNIGPDGTPFSTWYLTEDEPTPENMKFDGYLSYEYRPLYAGLPLSRLPAESTPQTAQNRDEIARIICCDGKCILADTDGGCILNDPKHDGDLKKADKIIALTRPKCGDVK